MEFLGYNQTFVGVLASLLVLCLVLNSSNLLRALLKNTRKSVVAAIDEMQKDVNGISSRKYQSSIAKRLKALTDDGKPLYADILKVEWDLKAARIISRYKPDFHLEVNNMILHIRNIKLRESAPLYSLICCMALFIADMAVDIWPDLLDFIVSAFSFWLFLSSLFWTTIWTRCRNGLPKYFNSSEDETNAKDQSEEWNITYRISICILVLLVLDICCFAAEFNTWICYAFFICVIIIPFTFAGISMCKTSKSSDDYSNGHSIKHLGILFGYSCIAAGVILIQSRLIYDITIPFHSTSPLTSGWCVFILINGLLMPYLIPYEAYRKCIRLTGDSIAKGLEDIEAKFNLLNQEIIEQSNTIPPSLP